MTPSLNTPIACSLGSGDFKERTAWIQQLAREHLLSARREELALHLSYSPGAREAVREMVEKEQDCCGFLRFDLSERRGSIDLTITAPEETAEVAGSLFDHFAPATLVDGGRP
jgi:hypothetical protein